MGGLTCFLRIFSISVLSFCVMAFAGAGVNAEAQAYQPPESLVFSGPVLHAATNYWTPERMKNAIPDPMRDRTRTNLTPGTSSPPAQGPSGFGESGLPAVASAIEKNFVLPFVSIPKSGSVYNYPAPFARYQNFDSYDVYPYSTIVKIFYTDAGRDYVCSGSVWPGRAVLTAGHCVYNNDARRYHTNVVAVPQYKNGSSPLGAFIATDLITISDYQNGNQGYDMALILTATKGGSKISTYTGWLGGMWNVTPMQHWTVIGYPAGRPFNGETQQVCQASYAYPDERQSPVTVGIGCDLTGGSSGCPWIVKFGGQGGRMNLVNGLMSYGYRVKDSYSPYFGSAAKKLWDYARSH